MSSPPFTRQDGRLLLVTLATAGLAFGGPVLVLLAGPAAPAAGRFDASRIGAWACCLLGLGALFAQVGFEVRGRFGGVLIDERNRYSLSRLQMVLWTGLVLGTLYVLFVASALRGPPEHESLRIAVDPNLVALMGFSLGTFVAAPLALNRKTAQPAAIEAVERANAGLGSAQQLSSPVRAAGSLLLKGAPADARLADLIRGEEVGDAATVDLPRTQMLLVTLVVVIGFGVAVFRRLAHGDGLDVGLPELGPTVLLLILVSHSGYLAGKLIPATGTAAGPGAEQTSRALVASQQASALALEIQSTLERLAPGDGRRPSIEASLSQARTIAADAAQLPRRLSSADFKPDEISLAEGRIESLRTGFRMVSTQRTQASDPAHEQTVAKVQRRLASLGHALEVTGIVDLATESAVQKWLLENGVPRSSLHPGRMRYYEELAELI